MQKTQIMQSNQSVSLEINDMVDDPAWDSFVAQCSGGYYQQTTIWASLKRSQGWESYRIQVRNEGRLIGGAQVQHRRFRKLASIGFISRGPISKLTDTAALVMQQVVEGLKLTAHSYLAVLPDYGWTNVVPVLTANGFFPKPNLLPPSKLTTATIIVDLTQDLDTILSKMRSSTRQSIRRGLKKGIEVTQGGEADIATFYRLMCLLCAHRGMIPDPPTIATFYEYWRFLAPAGMVKLFMGRYQSEDVCAAFAFVYGDTIWVWKVGWSGEHIDRRPNHILWWEMIKWAKDTGLRRFDFVQILPEHAKAILRGETIKDNYWGVTQFKLGFGGNILMIPDAYYRSFNSGAQTFLKLGGAKLLSHPKILKYADRLAQ